MLPVPSHGHLHLQECGEVGRDLFIRKRCPPPQHLHSDLTFGPGRSHLRAQMGGRRASMPLGCHWGWTEQPQWALCWPPVPPECSLKSSCLCDLHTHSDIFRHLYCVKIKCEYMGIWYTDINSRSILQNQFYVKETYWNLLESCPPWCWV